MNSQSQSGYEGGLVEAKIESAMVFKMPTVLRTTTRIEVNASFRCKGILAQI